MTMAQVPQPVLLTLFCAQSNVQTAFSPISCVSGNTAGNFALLFTWQMQKAALAAHVVVTCADCSDIVSLPLYDDNETTAHDGWLHQIPPPAALAEVKPPDARAHNYTERHKL